MPGARKYSSESHGECSKHDSTLEAPPMSPISELGLAEMEESGSRTSGMYVKAVDITLQKKANYFSTLQMEDKVK